MKNGSVLSRRDLVGTPGRIRTCDLLLRSRAASLPFSTCVPIVSSSLHQFREPAFAQRQNLFSCNYIRSERVLLRLCYVRKRRSVSQYVLSTALREPRISSVITQKPAIDGHLKTGRICLPA